LRAVNMAARVPGSPEHDRFRLDLADATTESGSGASRGVYEDLLKKAAPVPGGAVRLRLGLGRAQHLSNDRAGAFATLTSLANELDASTADGRPEAFWFAWTVALEILQSENVGGNRTPTIRTQLARLEAIDPDLGGEPWRTRLGAVSRQSR
jgi:hypothetical protein